MSKNTRSWAERLLADALAVYETGTTREIAVALTDTVPAVLQHGDSTRPGLPTRALRDSFDRFTAHRERQGRKTLVRLYAESYAASRSAFRWSDERGFEALETDTSSHLQSMGKVVTLHDLLVVIYAELVEPRPEGVAVVTWNDDPAKVLAIGPTLNSCVRQMNARTPLYRTTAARLVKSEEPKVHPCTRKYAELAPGLIQGKVGELLMTDVEQENFVSAKAAADAVMNTLRRAT